MRKFDPWPVFFKRKWARNWPFIAGFAIIGALITKFTAALTEEDAKNSRFVQEHNRSNLINGTWKTPAERCFLWIGGFKPSDLLKILMAPLDLLTEQQQAEEALSQGYEQLQQSLAYVVASGALNEGANVGELHGPYGHGPRQDSSSRRICTVGVARSPRIICCSA